MLATTSTVCHVVAVPYPGRGHVNPMINLCKQLTSKKPDILVTIVVTEEWVGFLRSYPFPDNVVFATIPNVLPSELVRSSNYPQFYEAVMTKMEAPFQHVLNCIQPPPTAIIADTELLWAIPAARSRNIPVASLWTASASVFSTKFENAKLNLSEGGDLKLEQIREFEEHFGGNDLRVMELALECISMVPKADYLLFTSVYELEPQVMDSLRAEFPFPVYPIGPAIPYLKLECDSSVNSLSSDDGIDYLRWLDSQPKESVLYISLGSFLSVSSTQMDEIAAGLRESGIRFLWVARGESYRLRKSCGDMGLVVSWCEQLKVLCHSSVVGFWSHCGWNSTLEAMYSGVTMLTFPLSDDQFPNSTKVVEDWKIGQRVRKEVINGVQSLMTREEVADIVQRFMNLESTNGKEMRNRAKELQDMCHRAIAKGGSSDRNLDDFIRDITKFAVI